MLSGSWDKTIKLWDAATGALIRTFEGHSDGVWSVAFSPDGDRVLSGSDDKTIKLWDAATGALIRTFEGHSGGVMSVAFSPDGARVLSGSEDKTIKLWDAATGALIRTFEGHSGWVTVGGVLARWRPRAVGQRTMARCEFGMLRLVSCWPACSASREGEWLAMTPAGFFASSRKGTEMLGVVRGLEVISLRQVFHHLYRPTLVEELLKGDPERKYKNEAFNLNLAEDPGLRSRAGVASPRTPDRAHGRSHQARRSYHRRRRWHRA